MVLGKEEEYLSDGLGENEDGLHIFKKERNSVHGVHVIKKEL